MNKISSKLTVYLILIGLTVAIVLVSFFSLSFGLYKINFIETLSILFTHNGSAVNKNVIFDIRLPRVIMALFSGIALSLAGLIYQEVFQNKLVSPSILGVSAGAAQGAAMAFVLGIGIFFVGLFSFAFALIACFLALFFAKFFNKKSNISLILAGIIVSSIFSSALSFTKFMAEDEQTLASITFWLMGSFEKATMTKNYILGAVVIVICIVIIFMRRQLNITSLGYEEATSRGQNYVLVRAVLVICATLLTGTTIAFTGLIGWVGLIIPHIVRLMVGNNNQKTVIITIPTGALFMIICDILSRSFTSQEIPISAITSAIGAVIFIIMLLTNKRRFQNAS